MIDKEYNKNLKKYHKLSDRHILVVETDMPYSDVLKVVALSDKIRKAGNELVSLMRKNYDQLLRIKRYRKLLFLYGNTEDKGKRKIYANQLIEMQKTYNVTCKNDKGKFNKKKRFGKSIKNRCPSGFQTTVEKKFKITGGTYIEVPNNYRASQYDHTACDYIKKKLSDRLYKLQNGVEVQRDWYSSFLLYCYDYRIQNIDKKKCITEFDDCYKKEKALIEWIKAHKIKVLNSGIKIA